MEIKLRKVIVNVTLDGDNYSKGDRDITGGHLFSGGLDNQSRSQQFARGLVWGLFSRPSPPPHTFSDTFL